MGRAALAGPDRHGWSALRKRPTRIPPRWPRRWNRGFAIHWLVRPCTVDGRDPAAYQRHPPGWSCASRAHAPRHRGRLDASARVRAACDGMPSRGSGRQSVHAPYAREFSSRRRWIEPVSSQYIDKAIGNCFQIGSTPGPARCASGDAIITSRDGRAPPGQKIANALRRIALARFNSAFSRSRCLNRSRFTRAALRAESVRTSARSTHARSLCAVQPIFPAIGIAAQRSRCSCRAPANPGAIHTAGARAPIVRAPSA